MVVTATPTGPPRAGAPRQAPAFTAPTPYTFLTVSTQPTNDNLVKWDYSVARRSILHRTLYVDFLFAQLTVDDFVTVTTSMFNANQ